MAASAGDRRGGGAGGGLSAMRNYAKAAAALAFTAYWYRECVRPLLYQPHYLALSFAIVPVVRWHHRRGGFASYAGTVTADAPSLAAVAKQELRNVAADWTAPLLCCARAHAVPLKRTYVDLFAAASALPSYASIGPLGLSRVIRGQLWFPVTQIGEIGHTLAIFSRWRGGALLCADALVLLLIFVAYMLLRHLANTLAHRFFAHRCFKTSRWFTWVLAAFCNTGTRCMWWSSVHRHHHRHCDDDDDPHSPARCGFGYAYLGWLFDRANFGARVQHLKDWEADAPELFAIELLYADRAHDFVDDRLLGPAKMFAAWYFVDPTDFVVTRFGELTVTAATLGSAFAVQMNLLFNAYSHDEHRGDKCAGGRCAAWDIPFRWFGLLSGGESHHARHHQHPTLACNAPAHLAHQDWVFGVILLLERCGLVWDVRKAPREAAKGKPD